MSRLTRSARPVIAVRRVQNVFLNGRQRREVFRAELRGDPARFAAEALYENEAIRLLLSQLRRDGRSGWLPDYVVLN